MSIIDIISGSGILGGIMSLGTRWFDIYAKRKETELEILRLEAASKAKSEEMAGQAFANSQLGVNEDLQVSDKASPWVINLGELVDCFRSFTRPGLTWALMFVLVLVFFNVPEARRAEMVDQITFGSFTALFWWFGSRFQKK